MKDKKEMEIVVTADDSQAKSKLERLSNYLENNFREEETQRINLSTKEAEKKINQLKSEISELDSFVKSLNKQEMASGFYTPQLQELQEKQTMLEKLQSTLINVANVKESKNSLSKTLNKNLSNCVKVVDKLGNSVSKGFSNAFKRARRFLFSLFSIHSAYLLLSKASNQYISNNEDLANRITAIWTYLGNLLGPIIEKIVSIVEYGIAYLNAFIKLMTGKDYLTESINNSAKSANKAQSEMKKLVSSMDEVVNLDTSGNGNIDTGITDALKNIQEIDDIDLTNFYEKGKAIADALNKGMSSIDWDVVEESARNAGENFGLFLNGAIENLQWDDIGTTIAEGLNTAFDFIDEFSLTFNWDGLGKGLSETFNSFFNDFEWEDASKSISKFLNGLLDTMLENVKNLDFETAGYAITDFLLSLDWGTIITKVIQIIGYIVRNNIDLITGILTAILDKAIEVMTNPETLYIAGKDIILGLIDGILAVIDSVGNAFNKIIDRFKKMFGINSPSTLFMTFGKYIMQGLINGINSMIPNIGNTFNTIKNKVSSAISSIQSHFSLSSLFGGGGGGGGGGRFASGGFPEEGQMFFARESGPELVGTIGGSTAVVNNTQIVDAVSAGVANAVASVLTSQESSSSNATYLYINGSEFAKAIYSDMEQETNRRNRSTSIRRV